MEAEGQMEDVFSLPLSICIRHGMNYEDTWDYTLAELLYIAKQYQEKEKIELQSQLTVANWLSSQIALAIHDPKKMSSVADDFPDLFGSPEKDSEDEKIKNFKNLAMTVNAMKGV